MSLTTLRRNLALVPQEVLLFGGSIRKTSPTANRTRREDEIIAAAKKANAHDFIAALPEGYAPSWEIVARSFPAASASASPSPAPFSPIRRS
jgi:ABC-type transport system involved in Fe-S cluster assembly fused permease/ATPase subunit